MKKAFDWAPLLETDEVIVWQETHSERAVVWIALVAAIGSAALSYFIVSSVFIPASVEASLEMSRPSGSAKAVLAFTAGLIMTVVFTLSSFSLCFVDNHLAITSRRIITLHSAAWRKAPRIKSLPLKQVGVDPYGKESRTVKVRDASLSLPALPWLEWGNLKSHRSNRAFAAAIEAAKTAHLSNPSPAPLRTKG